MLVVLGLDPRLCLLLSLLNLCSPEGGHPPPRRRFEYKLSFKGPRLALPGAGIPFWSHHGDAIPGLEEVRLAPSMRNRSGAVWSRTPVLFSAWEVDMQMRVTGPGRRGAQGMAVWYTQGRGQVGSVLGALASGDGIGILFDSLAEDVQNSPAIRVLAGDGHTLYEPLGDGGSRVLGSCHRDFRNRPYPFRARITYWGQRLRVSFNSGLTPSDPDEVCVDVGPLLLAPGGFFGVSAATSTLADDHDVLSFLTFSLSEPGPEPPLQPFLEAEHLRLARQLKGLQARLALGTKEDMIPKLNSEVQEEGERIFDLEETLDRHRQILQALQGLSKQLAQAKKQWKKQLGSPGQARLEGAWDSAKVSALLHGQRTLLQDLQEMRHAAAHMASRAQVFYLPVGTKHHFLELAQTLSLLQKDLRAPAVRGKEGKPAAKDTYLHGRPPGVSSCLQPGFFLFILLIQTVGFFCYVHFSSKQELDKNLLDYLSTGSFPLSPAPQIPKALGVLRRQPPSPSIHA
ncbi:protein ERGIC-53-like isoform X3 [Camelus bactrianus]|uniref:Protein ERGIC-53-like isoform X2 n=2 Tax=Camelus TaxID=9836 RepID=A0A9W3G5M6_CAMBA|nr:protein ERGIC-53-like isoform X2 [Camelus dromedarius]XP_045372806.1 protein ERGIC-53-like isoform X2 [Camelus bactrianus]